MKAVFDCKLTNNLWRDELPNRYFFGPSYLAIVLKCIDDWVVLRQPRADGGSMAYFAAAKIGEVIEVIPGGRYSAEFSDFTIFGAPVKWRIDTVYREESLREVPMRRMGRYLEGKSVRPLGDLNFESILTLGLTSPGVIDEFIAPHVPEMDTDRRTATFLTNRKIRDAAFQRAVLKAYGQRCAVTGLRILDRRKRSEAQAAHIWGVAEGGPDAVQNGIALSTIAHWMFDRDLISIREDYSLKIDDRRIPPQVLELLRPFQARIGLPADEFNLPHVSYIRKRAQIMRVQRRFKG